MGDLIGNIVEGTLCWVPAGELRRLRTSPVPEIPRAALLADACRLNTLYMIARAGSGHIGSSFSSMDIVTLFHAQVLREQDLYFSSKGHDAPGLYSVLIAFEKLPFESLHQLRQIDGLPGHPRYRYARHGHEHGFARHGDLQGQGHDLGQSFARARRQRIRDDPVTASSKKDRSGSR